MSRKHDRRQQIETAAFRTLQASLRPQPWWLPRFIWRPIQALALKIAFL
jgi:hypothetical protein